jgi:hypothetical protein
MYKLTLLTTIIRLSDRASIPADPTNTDYATYLQWLSEDNTPEPADIPPVIIQPVSPRQIRQALTATGLRASVEAAIAAGEQGLKDWWEFSTAFDRLHPSVIEMGAALEQPPEALDALWALAESL